MSKVYVLLSCVAGILGIFFTVGKKVFTKKKSPYIIVSLKKALE